MGEELRSDDEDAALPPLPVRARRQRTESAMVSHAKVAHEQQTPYKRVSKIHILHNSISTI